MVLVCGASPALGGDAAEALEAFINGTRSLAGVEIRFEAGREGYRGRNVVVAKGDGRLTLEQRLRGRSERFEDRLSEEGLRAILRALHEARPWPVSSPGGSQPFDATEITVRATSSEGDLDLELRFIESEVAEQPRLVHLVEIFRALVDVLKSEHP
jgi:hypothetical protein